LEISLGCASINVDARDRRVVHESHNSLAKKKKMPAVDSSYLDPHEFLARRTLMPCEARANIELGRPGTNYNGDVSNAALPRGSTWMHVITKASWFNQMYEGEHRELPFWAALALARE
jgi:hypothetical protein